jgi:protease I
MSDSLKKKRVAILATDGVEQVELLEPSKALQDAGATADVISPKSGQIKGWNHTDWGQKIPVDVELKSADPNQYDALLLPGGVMNPDHLRQDPDAVKFVKSFFEAHKPVAAICHGPWLLVEADVVRGRKVTSWPSLKTDIRNAGGQWTDEQVVTDQGLVTSRKPDDIPAFNKKMVEEFTEGKHAAQHA